MLRLATLALAALLVVPTLAAARVGVTSVAAGTPLGQPPQQAERVLQVGVDVFAEERITTGAHDRTHLLFLDGTSLTVGPEAQVTIDRFVYDSDRRLGELAVTASRGLLRIVGGAVSKQGVISVTTPSAHIGIRGGIAVIDVDRDGTTRADFLYGISMTVATDLGTEIANQAGQRFQVRRGHRPGRPFAIPRNELVPATVALERPRLAPPTGATVPDAALAGLTASNSNLPATTLAARDLATPPWGGPRPQAQPARPPADLAKARAAQLNHIRQLPQQPPRQRPGPGGPPN